MLDNSIFNSKSLSTSHCNTQPILARLFPRSLVEVQLQQSSWKDNPAASRNPLNIIRNFRYNNSENDFIFNRRETYK